MVLVACSGQETDSTGSTAPGACTGPPQQGITHTLDIDWIDCRTTEADRIRTDVLGRHGGVV